MSWLKKYQLPEYQIIGTVPFAPSAAPAQNTSNNQGLSLSQPEPTIHLKLNDPRKTRMTTGQKINPNVDLVSGEYLLNDIDTVLKMAKGMGLSVEDAYNLAAMDLQETGWGNKDGEVGHALHGKGDSVHERFINAYSEKMKEADRLKIKDPMLRLQVYNGMGVVTPKTEKDYHGFEMQKIYGVPIPKGGISMRKNPLYGKQVIDLRDNVLKKNPNFVNYINSIYQTPSKRDGGWLHKYQKGGNFPTPYSNEVIDEYQQDYNNFYAPPKQYGNDDGYDAYYHSIQGKAPFNTTIQNDLGPTWVFTSDNGTTENKQTGEFPKEWQRKIDKGRATKENFKYYPNYNVDRSIDNSDRVASYLQTQAVRKSPIPWLAQGGQPPVNPNGMYDGIRDWRIPGGNITMKGVPFPVLAKASNGMSAIMQPGGEYNFPGASHVDEYPMMEEGGWLEQYQTKGRVTLPPIYTDDPNLVKAFTDSSHNFIKFNLPGRKIYNNVPITKHEDYRFAIDILKLAPDKAKELVEKQNKEYANWALKKYGEVPLGYNMDQFDNKENQHKPFFAKPVQEYILQKLNKKVTHVDPISASSMTTPSLRTMQIPNIQLSGRVPEGHYRVEYFDPELKQETHRMFMTQAESDAFANELSKRSINGTPSAGNITQRVQYKFGGSELKNGGWLEKYQDKGFVIPGVTDFVMPKPVSESSALGIQSNRIVSNEKLPTREVVTEIPEYIVKSGDTLSKIASAYNTTPMKLAQYNNIANPNVIGVNQKIKIPVAKQIPQEYQDWETIKQRNQQADLLSDEQKIISYYGNRPDDSYLVVDKKNAKMNLYKGNKLVKSYEVGVGANPGDAQTVTRVVNGKTDWTGGNKSTGAGVYTISRVDPKSHEYFGLPAFNLKNDQGLEVATTIHGTPLARRARFDNNDILDNRMSNGCINGKCFDLQDMYGKVDVGSKVYILPEDQGNQFQIVDGKPVLKVNAKNRAKYNEYVDQTGQKRKGQGANQSINTLQYKPITSTLDEKAFKNDVYQANDFNDDNEYTYTTKPYVNALVNNKQKIMQATHIPSDVYNEIAKMSFGIYGTESNFGDTHSALGNFGRAIGKWWNPKGSSSPDYQSKATTYGADEESNSVGLTQMRWSYLNKDEKDALTKLGITSNKDLLNAEKAAIATTAVLAIRYNQQLTDAQKKDIWTYLPTKWNTRANYGSRVKNNSKYLTFKQLDEVRKKDGGWLNTYK